MTVPVQGGQVHGRGAKHCATGAVVWLGSVAPLVFTGTGGQSAVLWNDAVEYSWSSGIYFSLRVWLRIASRMRGSEIAAYRHPQRQCAAQA